MAIDLKSLSKRVEQARNNLKSGVSSTFSALKQGAKDTLSSLKKPTPKSSTPITQMLKQGVKDLPKSAEVASRKTGQLLQKFPDTTLRLPTPPKIPGLLPVTPKPNPLGQKVLETVTSVPGSMVRSYGKTIERVGTPEGREELKSGARSLLTTKPGLQTINNPAVQTALDLTDFGPGGLIFGGLKAFGKEGAEKLAREGAEKVAREAAEKAAIEAGQTTSTEIAKKSGSFLGDTLEKGKSLFGQFAKQRTKIAKISDSLDAAEQVPHSSQRGIITKIANLKDQLFTESRKILNKMGNSGKEIARRIDEYNNVSERFAGKSTSEYENAVKGLKDKEIEDVLKSLDGQAVTLKSPKQVEAVTKLRSVLNTYADEATKAKLEIRLPDNTSVPFHPRENYLPHTVDPKKLKANRDVAINYLVQTKQIEDVKTAAKFVDEIISGTPVAEAYKRFNPNTYLPLYGNLEFARLLNWPSDVLRYDKSLLPEYFLNASKRINRALNFGEGDQEIAKLLIEVAKEGKDASIAEEILQRNLGLIKESRALAEGGAMIRQAESTSKLGLAAISNLGQTVNTATKYGVRDTLKGIVDAFTPGGREFALRTGSTLDQVIREYEEEVLGKGVLSKITAPGHSAVEKLNRIIAANTGKSAAVRKGVTDPEELLKAGQEAVNITQFKTRPIDLPPAWSSATGKVATQFKNFAFRQANFVEDNVLKPALKGDIRPLARYLLLGTLAGEGIADLKAMARNRNRPTDPKERILDNLSTVGGYGTYQDAVNALLRGQGAMLSFLTGPAVGDAAKIAGGVGSAIQGKPKDLGKALLGNVPIVGQTISNTLFPQKQPYKTRVPDLLDQGVNEIQGNNYSERAETLYNKINKLPPEKQQSILEGVEKEDSSLFSAYTKHVSDVKNNVTPREKSLRELGVKDGSRPKAISEEMRKLKTGDERKELLKRYVEIGIINDADTMNKVLESWKEGKPQSSVEKGVENVLSAFTPSAKAAETPLQTFTPSAEINRVSQKVSSAVPIRARKSAEKSVPFIAQALKDEGIYSPQILAYAMATVEHETAGTFEPIEEYSGRQQARKLGYKGGENYFGRGFIQLTHDYNYREIGRRIGLGDKLVENPELALDPQISAKILAAFFKDRGVAGYASKGNFIGARRPVNPDRNAGKIAQRARYYLRFTK